LYDALGMGYTLLRTDAGVNVQPLVDAAVQRGVPLQVLDLAADVTEDLYPQKLVLVRPDQHVAWRGDVLPADPLALVDRVRGA